MILEIESRYHNMYRTFNSKSLSDDRMSLANSHESIYKYIERKIALQ